MVNNISKRSLILISGGDHCKSKFDVAESAGYNIKGILDVPDEVGKENLSIDKVFKTSVDQRYVYECENDGLEDTIWFADRIVNIPSSVRWDNL